MSTTNLPETATNPVLPAPASERGAAPRRLNPRRRIYAVTAPLLVLLVLWMYLFYGEGAFKGGPGGKDFGADYTMFVSAAHVLQSAGDPYNPQVLLRAETAWMQRLHRPMIKRSQRAQVRVGNPPLLYWAMRPLIDASFVPAAVLSLVGLYVVSLVGFLATLRYFGWRNYVVPTFIFALMPQVVLGAFYGNVVGIVLGAVGLSLLLSRRYPALAGLLMCLAWLKPPIGLPVVLVLGLFHARQRMQFLAGFVAGTVGLLFGTAWATGWHSLALWIHGLLRYSNDMAIQPDVVSLSGLYVRWMPYGPRLLLEGLTIALGVGLTGYFWRTQTSDRNRWLAVAPLWVIWMLASPYGHFFDEMILAVPMAAYLGQNGRRVRYRLPGLSLYLLFFSLFFISWAPGGVYLLPIPLLLIAYFMVKSRDDVRFAA